MDQSAEFLPAFSILLFLKFLSSKSSDAKIFGHFNFRTKSLSEIKLVRNFSFLMYFNYIEVPHFLDEMKLSQLSDKLMENFFGKLTERTVGKNLRTGDMVRRITNCAFT